MWMAASGWIDRKVALQELDHSQIESVVTVARHHVACSLYVESFQCRHALLKFRYPRIVHDVAGETSYQKSGYFDLTGVLNHRLTAHDLVTSTQDLRVPVPVK